MESSSASSWTSSSAIVATGLPAASIACPISGHHQFGTWWFGQMACMLALVAIVLAIVWLIGFFVRGIEGARWYRW